MGFDDSDELHQKVEKECDFVQYHKSKDAFDELRLDTTASKDGGPNKCFRINHYDGPAIIRNEDGSLPSESNQFYEVCGKRYQVETSPIFLRSTILIALLQATGATYEFAVNPNGMVAMMNIMVSV
jgi:hypothetical protein